jgi:CMP-N-acetylneuraminic acid synthetase
MSKKVVGFIPAKGTSTRLESKNKRKILGVPLFLWAANNLSRVLPKSDIYIDSENDEILSLAKSHGFNTIKRPKSLATNQTDGNGLLEWEASNVDADVYIQHLPPMPFCKKETIMKGIKAIEEGFETAVFVHSEKKYEWKNNKPAYDINNIPNSFDLDPLITECMGLYVIDAKSFTDRKTRIGKKHKLIQIDDFENVDIDYEHDFIKAKALANYFSQNDFTDYIDGVKNLHGTF